MPISDPVGRFLYPTLTFHIPVPACGKDKKQTSACRPHAGRTSISDVIVMLTLRHHVTSQRIQDFPEVFFMFSNIK